VKKPYQQTTTPAPQKPHVQKQTVSEQQKEQQNIEETGANPAQNAGVLLKLLEFFS